MFDLTTTVTTATIEAITIANQLSALVATTEFGSAAAELTQQVGTMVSSVGADMIDNVGNTASEWFVNADWEK